MPIEIDHHTPWGREQYRFRPWHERPLTERQLQVSLALCGSVTAGLVGAAGVAIWLAGLPVRWLAEPILVSVLVLMAVAGRDIWFDLRAERRKGP